MARHSPEIRLRPVTEADLDMFRRFAVEPGLIGLDWAGFRDPKTVQRRFDTDSYLGADDGRLTVDVAAETDPGWEPAGLVSYQRRSALFSVARLIRKTTPTHLRRSMTML